MPSKIENLDKLLPEEIDELRTIYSQWEYARNNKYFVLADKLRDKLKLWDESLNYVTNRLWNPHFEHNLNRQRRACIRMRKYGISVYPWELKDAA